MREHPIPQDITGYRFHIVGSMTIKQFAEIAIGVFFGFLVYQTNLIPVLKWPLIGLVVALGAGAAFVPIEERPLDHWIMTFFKVLYKPTKFFWRREPKVPEAFLYTPSSTTNNETDYVDLTPARRQRIHEYLSSVQNPELQNGFETGEVQHIASIMSMFDNMRVNVEMDAHKGSHKPNLKVRVRSLAHTLDLNNAAVVDQTQIFQETYSVAIPQTTYETSHTILDPSQAATEMMIPETMAVEVDSTELVPEVQAAPQTTAEYTYVEATVTDSVEASHAATTNKDLPFPSKPSEPNKLVGMVLSPQNELINDAIIEIKKDSGETVRAVKSNALGQFFIMTPLANGTYVVSVEREGMNFEPVQLTLTGSVVDPIEIRSYN